MTYQEYDKKMDAVIQDLQSENHGKLMLGIAASALTFIRQRVTEEGIDSKGQPFKPYSTKDMLVGCKSFVQKSACEALLGSKAKRKKLEWRTVGGSGGFSGYLSVSSGNSGMTNGGKGVRLAILKGGYKKLRDLQGRQTNHFDMTVTGNTWKDINIISSNSEHQSGMAIIGARNKKYQEILAGNTKKAWRYSGFKNERDRRYYVSI